MNINVLPVLIEQVEIEAKLRFPSRDRIDLLSSGEDFSTLVNSEGMNVKDIYLDTPNSLLTKEDNLFRVRIYTSSTAERTELSWKGPRLDKEIDTREDVSLLFQGNLEKEFIRFYKKLGYEPIIIIAKHRKESKVGDFEFELDQDLYFKEMSTKIEKYLGDFISVCVSIPLLHTPDELIKGREKVMRKLAELSTIARLESRTYDDLFHTLHNPG